MNETAQVDPMAGLEEVKSQWVKWGKPGDWIRGTLTDVREMDSSFEGKDKVKVYEVMLAGGSFHYFEKVNGETTIDDAPTIPEPGSIWNVGGKAGIDNQMRNVKIGQIFGMRFSEEKPNKNKSFSPTKVIKVMIGEMDPHYQGESAADMAG